MKSSYSTSTTFYLESLQPSIVAKYSISRDTMKSTRFDSIRLQGFPGNKNQTIFQIDFCKRCYVSRLQTDGIPTEGPTKIRWRSETLLWCSCPIHDNANSMCSKRYIISNFIHTPFECLILYITIFRE